MLHKPLALFLLLCNNNNLLGFCFLTIDELSQPVPILQPEEQTINVIDFGYRTIEIITNDHLVLVDNRNLTTKKKDLYHR